MTTQTIQDLVETNSGVWTMRGQLIDELPQEDHGPSLDDVATIRKAAANDVKKKEVTIVYNIDCAKSILSAAMLKRYTDSLDKKVAPGLLYTFVYKEVASFYINDVSDAYIWLHTPAIVEAVSPAVTRAFNKAEQIIVDDNYYPSRMNSYTECLKRYSSDMPTFRRYGALVRAFAALSQATTCLGDWDLGNIYQLDRRDARLEEFSSPLCTSIVLLKMFKMINDSVRYLGQPHYHDVTEDMDVAKNAPLITLVKEGNPLALAYHRAYSEIKAAIDSQVSQQQVRIHSKSLFKSDKVATVFSTRLTQGFWLAKRILDFTGRHYHNSRLTEYGTHKTTSLPAQAGEIALGTAATATHH